MPLWPWTIFRWCQWLRTSFRKQQENRAPLKSIAFLNSGGFFLKVHMDLSYFCESRILYHYIHFLLLISYLWALIFYCMHLYEKAQPNKSILLFRALFLYYAQFEIHFSLYFTAILWSQENEVLLSPLSRYRNVVSNFGL